MLISPIDYIIEGENFSLPNILQHNQLEMNSIDETFPLVLILIIGIVENGSKYELGLMNSEDHKQGIEYFSLTQIFVCRISTYLLEQRKNFLLTIIDYSVERLYM